MNTNNMMTEWANQMALQSKSIMENLYFHNKVQFNNIESFKEVADLLIIEFSK